MDVGFGRIGSRGQKFSIRENLIFIFANFFPEYQSSTFQYQSNQWFSNIPAENIFNKLDLGINSKTHLRQRVMKTKNWIQSERIVVKHNI